MAFLFFLQKVHAKVKYIYIFFIILKGEKVPKVLKRERKVQKKKRENCKKDIASIPTYFEIQCLSNEGFFSNRLSCYGFFGDPLWNFFFRPPLKKFFGDPPQKKVFGEPPKKVFWGVLPPKIFFGEPDTKKFFCGPP